MSACFSVILSAMHRIYLEGDRVGEDCDARQRVKRHRSGGDGGGCCTGGSNSGILPFPLV